MLLKRINFNWFHSRTSIHWNWLLPQHFFPDSKFIYVYSHFWSINILILEQAIVWLYDCIIIVECFLKVEEHHLVNTRNGKFIEKCEITNRFLTLCSSKKWDLTIRFQKNSNWINSCGMEKCWITFSEGEPIQSKVFFQSISPCCWN